jgi:hypothetical protein
MLISSLRWRNIMDKHTKFLFLLADYMEKNPRQRYGQAVFNLMYSIEAYIADRYRATEYDPFYRDDKAPLFVKKCLSWIEDKRVMNYEIL